MKCLVHQGNCIFKIQNSATSNRSFSTVNSNPRFQQKSRLSMNSPFKDHVSGSRPRTGNPGFPMRQRPGTSTGMGAETEERGIPLRSTMSSYNASSFNSQNENRERPATGISRHYSNFNQTQENQKYQFRSDGQNSSAFDTPVNKMNQSMLF